MQIYLDSSIKDFIFFPLLLLIFSMLFFKVSLTNYLSVNIDQSEENLNEEQKKQVLHSRKIQRLKNLIKNSGLISKKDFEMRKEFYEQNQDYLQKPIAPQQDLQQMMDNPQTQQISGMQNTLIQQALKYLFLPIQLKVINFFFKGFIVGRIGLSLGQKFKEFLQNGLDLQNLDSQYLSATSLYFVTYMGITKLIERFLTCHINITQTQQKASAPAQSNPLSQIMGQQQGAQQNQTVLELEQLKKTTHEFLFENEEEKLMEYLQQEKQ